MSAKTLDLNLNLKLILNLNLDSKNSIHFGIFQAA